MFVSHPKKKRKKKEKKKEVDKSFRGGTKGKSGFVSHTKHTAEATNMDLFHS